MPDSNRKPAIPPSTSTRLGADAAAAPASAPLRPLLLRVAVGALAILGLSGIGAASMLAGLDGAHASPPQATNLWLDTAPSAAPKSVAATARAPAIAQAAEPSASSAAAGSPQPSCPTVTAEGKVILNRADENALRKIPGIGPKRAEAILALRAKLKRFRRPTDLLRVKGIGPKSLVRMQPHFVVDEPSTTGCEAPVTPK